MKPRSDSVTACRICITAVSGTDKEKNQHGGNLRER